MKYHVHCSLPNASTRINGVLFAEHETKPGVMRSVHPVEEPVAEHFLSIPGYDIEQVEEQKPADSDDDGAANDSKGKGKGKPKPESKLV